MAQISSIFSQIIQLVPRPLFDKAVAQHKGMRHARGFSLLGPVRLDAVLPAWPCAQLARDQEQCKSIEGLLQSKSDEY